LIALILNLQLHFQRGNRKLGSAASQQSGATVKMAVLGAGNELRAGHARVAIFVRDLGGGGGATRDATLLANALAARGINIILLTLNSTGPVKLAISPKIRIVHVGASKLRSAVPALRATLRSEVPDVVLSSEAAQNIIAYLAVRSLPTARRPKLILREVASPSVALRRDAYMQNRLAYRVIGPVYRRADKVITLTAGARDDLVDNFGIPIDRIFVMRSNAVIDDETIVRLAGWDGDSGRQPGLIVSIGRLSPEKDHVALIRAFALVTTPGTRLVLVGEGPMRPTIEALIVALGLSDRVELTGQVADPFAWLMRASLSVTASWFEGLGNALIEALACGTPVVSTDCPHGPREILDGGTFGTLVPVSDIAAMATAIDLVLQQPVDRRRLRERVAHYQSTSAASEFIGLLNQVLPEAMAAA
jgi:glycosyltransferase involved in cell wall biosynthesis